MEQTELQISYRQYLSIVSELGIGIVAPPKTSIWLYRWTGVHPGVVQDSGGQMAEERKQVMTTDAGRPVGDNQNSLTVGARGPVVFEDYLLFEKMAHFNRERIPERVVHADGSGAYGHFVCTSAEITNYTTAKVFEPGKKTPLFIRFSTVGGA